MRTTAPYRTQGFADKPNRCHQPATRRCPSHVRYRRPYSPNTIPRPANISGYKAGGMPANRYNHGGSNAAYIIQVTHSEANAEYGNRVINLKNGWIVEDRRECGTFSYDGYYLKSRSLTPVASCGGYASLC